MTSSGGDRDDWDQTDGEPIETERLALDDSDERLPWLESSEDDDYDDEDSGNGKVIGLAIAALVLLGALVGGIWWATHRDDGGDVVADGSLVPAPPGPYKEAPKDPGGKTFAGTGDSSFAVSEGQNRPAQLDGSAAAPAPAPAIAPAPAETPKAAPSASATPAAAGGVGVQIGAFSSKATAEAGWQKLVAQANGVLSGVSHRVIEGKADNGTIFRLQAVASDNAGAQALCGRLKSAGIACQVK